MESRVSRAEKAATGWKALAILGVATMSMSFAAPASAVLLALDFQDGHSSELEDGFEAFNEADARNAAGKTFANGITINVQVSCFAGLNCGNDRNSLTDSGAFTYAGMYNDFIYNFGDNPVLDIEISGLTPDWEYELRFFSSDYFLGHEDVLHTDITTTFTPVGDTAGGAMAVMFDRTTVPTTNNERSAVGMFSSPTGTLSFEILGTGTGGGPEAGSYSWLNGLILAHDLGGTQSMPPIPEPSSALVFMAGLAVVAGKMRRRA